MEKSMHLSKVDQNTSVVLDENMRKSNIETLNSSYFSNQHCHCLMQNPLYDHLTKQTKKVDKLTAENEKLSFENNELENDIKKLQNQMKQLGQEHIQKIEQLKRRHKQEQEHAEKLYQEKLANKDKFIYELEGKVVGMNQSKSQLFAQYLQAMKFTDDSKQVAEYHQKIDQLNESICKMLQKLQQKNKQLEKKTQRIDQLETTNKQISSQLQQLRVKNIEIVPKLKEYEKKLKEKQTESKRTIQRYNETLQHSKFLLDEERVSKDKIIEQLNNLHQLQISRYEKKIIALQNAMPSKQTIKGLERKLEREQNKNNELERELKQARQNYKIDVNEQDQRIDRLLKEIQTLKRDNKDIKDTSEQQKQSLIIKNQKMLAFLNENLAILQRKNEEVTTKYNETQRKNYILQQQKGQLQRKALKIETQFQNKYRSTIRQSTMVEQNLKEQINQLSKQKKDLTRILQDRNEQNSIIKDKLQNYATMLMKKQLEKNNELQRQKQNYNQKLSQTMKKLRQQQSKNAKLRELLHLHEQNKKVQIENIQSLEDRHKSEMIAYHNHLRLYEGTINQLKKEKKYLEETKDQWKNKYDQLMEIKNLINNNYEQDCQLWQNKLKVLENIINGNNSSGVYK